MTLWSQARSRLLLHRKITTRFSAASTLVLYFVWARVRPTKRLVVSSAPSPR